MMKFVFLLALVELLVSIAVNAMYCDQYHYKVICEKEGQLMPTNLTQYGLIKDVYPSGCGNPRFARTFYEIGGNICQSPVSFLFYGWRGEWYNITFIPT